MDGSDQRLYYTNDANMNVAALVNPSGQVVERYAYDPYGRLFVLNGAADADGAVAEWSADANNTSDWDNDVLYCGYRRITQGPYASLYHVRSRWYHPTLGRWVTRDPMRYVDGLNLYEYGVGAPTSVTDPRGTAVVAMRIDVPTRPWTVRRESNSDEGSDIAALPNPLSFYMSVRLDSCRSPSGKILMFGLVQPVGGWVQLPRTKDFECDHNNHLGQHVAVMRSGVRQPGLIWWRTHVKGRAWAYADAELRWRAVQGGCGQDSLRIRYSVRVWVQYEAWAKVDKYAAKRKQLANGQEGLIEWEELPDPYDSDTTRMHQRAGRVELPVHQCEMCMSPENIGGPLPSFQHGAILDEWPNVLQVTR